jgi:hypothetical protein
MIPVTLKMSAKYTMKEIKCNGIRSLTATEIKFPVTDPLPPPLL